ncbi:MAG: triose-phosphate isomerase [Microbacteriaceae bacterium]
MAIKRLPLIAGNWKMNQNHLEAILLLQTLDWTLRDAKHSSTEVETAIFPPFTDLRSVQTLISADKMEFSFGAQDVSAHASGAYTGEIAASFIRALDAKYVLVGHSERRTMHDENDELIAAKSVAAIKNGLVPVICVGETEADLAEFGPSAIPVKQLGVVLAATKASDEIVVAYEPVWAIGSGKAATPEQAEEVAAKLRQTIADAHGQEQADRTRILYGGSVKANNIASLMRQANVDGALVGGASLDVKEFASIIQFKKHVGL